jgi:hypothetical protein
MPPPQSEINDLPPNKPRRASDANQHAVIFETPEAGCNASFKYIIAAKLRVRGHPCLLSKEPAVMRASLPALEKTCGAGILACSRKDNMWCGHPCLLSKKHHVAQASLPAFQYSTTPPPHSAAPQ